jgi:hypothetical protein
MRIKPTLLLSCVLLVCPAAAFAQAPPTKATPMQQTAPPPAKDSANCTPMSPNGTTTPEHSTVGRAGGGGELGDKLAQSDGVLCPPSNVDPAMRAPAPETGKMPVIPPPGSPGGDQSVRPK